MWASVREPHRVASTLRTRRIRFSSSALLVRHSPTQSSGSSEGLCPNVDPGSGACRRMRRYDAMSSGISSATSSPRRWSSQSRSTTLTQAARPPARSIPGCTAPVILNCAIAMAIIRVASSRNPACPVSSAFSQAWMFPSEPSHTSRGTPDAAPASSRSPERSSPPPSVYQASTRRNIPMPSGLPNGERGSVMSWYQAGTAAAKTGWLVAGDGTPPGGSNQCVTAMLELRVCAVILGA